MGIPAVKEIMERRREENVAHLRQANDAIEELSRLIRNNIWLSKFSSSPLSVDAAMIVVDAFKTQGWDAKAYLETGTTFRVVIKLPEVK